MLFLVVRRDLGQEKELHFCEILFYDWIDHLVPKEDGREKILINRPKTCLLTKDYIDSDGVHIQGMFSRWF